LMTAYALVTRHKSNSVGEIDGKIGIEDIGEAKEFLSLKLRPDRGCLWIGQQGCIEGFCNGSTWQEHQQYGLEPRSAKRMSRQVSLSEKTPCAGLIRALMYLATMTRPDISYEVGVLMPVHSGTDGAALQCTGEVPSAFCVISALWHKETWYRLHARWRPTETATTLQTPMSAEAEAE
jgi:hypothetical protein